MDWRAIYQGFSRILLAAGVAAVSGLVGEAVAAEKPSEKRGEATVTGEVEAAKNLFELSDKEKRKTLGDLVDNLSGKFVFPVPKATERQKREALLIGNSYYEFGSDRGSVRVKHKGCDIYGFGNDIGAFADGVVEEVGRYISKLDHGNIILINHGEMGGYEVKSLYLHVGAVAEGLKKGDKVKMGSVIARTDCTGISNKKLRLYNPGSQRCRDKAHLHFQLKIGGSWINPSFFWSDYTKSQLPSLRRKRLSMVGDDTKLKQDIRGFKGKERQGSFSKLVAAVVVPNGIVSMVHPEGELDSKGKLEYYDCGPLFYTQDVGNWLEGIVCFGDVAEKYQGTRWEEKAKTSVGTLRKRISFVSSEQIYELGKPYFNSDKPEDWGKAKLFYQEVAGREKGELGRKAELSLKTLNRKLESHSGN